ncbi:MAG TPA: hypothetical protein VH092_30480, partial [Urbifossiella sp.]|nr:hypothetical protein [Urbifossiella sp.]
MSDSVGFLLVAAAVLAAAYLLYRATPAARWRRRVVAHLRALQARHTALAAETDRAELELARLDAEYFTRLLASIPTDRLADYPGVGPATVDKVKQAAGPRIADVLGHPLNGIPDIGPVRATAIVNALEAVFKDARARFDAGGCP